ncbi:MAG: alanine racemase [Planctomycetes bacterium]|nr:alanine racemase [Planctomycetota bacterium]
MNGYLRKEISPSAVRHNLKLLRNCLTPGTKLCAVVKCDCYGHGLDQLLDTIADCADCLAVATLHEAVDLRRRGYKSDILAFFPPGAYVGDGEDRASLAEFIAHGITLTLTAIDDVAVVAEAAARTAVQARVHVMIDTGMTRGGIMPADAARLFDAVRAKQAIRVTGMYTHFATADEAEKDFTREQLRRFLAAVDTCGGRAGLTLHAANSAATIDLPDTHLDMVRPGISLYGCQPSEHMRNVLALRPAMRVVGRLMEIKDVPPGTRCGYGLTYRFDRPSRVGLVPIGYGDGYFRCLSNRATMRIGRRYVPVRGMLSMDQTIVDLTETPEVKVGQEVEIISNDPAAPNSVENLVRLAGMIPYELTSRLGRRVRPVSVD